MPRPPKPAPRKRAIEALRAGASQREAGLAAGVTKRTIQRWQLDPEFAAAVRGGMIITLGSGAPAPATTPAPPPEPKMRPSRMWFDPSDGTCIGSVINPTDSHVLVGWIHDPGPAEVERVRACLAAGLDPDEHRTDISPRADECAEEPSRDVAARIASAPGYAWTQTA